MKLATTKRFKFLFVGGTIQRKGPDLLLEAYLESFTAADDVCLVIKDFSASGVYAGQTLEAQILAARARSNAPEILYLTDELAPEALPGLYTACDCLVHPYRGEGFGLPVLEAMACGRPVIVTGGGATDDFATDDFAYRLPAVRRNLGGTVGGLPLVRDGWWLEPDTRALGEKLRHVVANPDEARAHGQAASGFARREFTWERAAEIAHENLLELVSRKQAEAEALRVRRARQVTSIELPDVAKLGHLSAARALLERKQFLEAWSATLAAMAERPFHPEAQLFLAEIARAAGDFPEARRRAERARGNGAEVETGLPVFEESAREASHGELRVAGR